MKIESQLLEDHQIKLTVEVEPGPFEDAKRKAAREISKRAKIPGFRPGKAPYHVIERYAGEKAILADAMDLLVKELYPKIIEESGIKPYGPGSLEKIPSENPPVFEFVIPLEAEVTLGDFHAVRIPYEPKSVSDDEVDQVIENMRTQQAIIEPVDRPAQEGDMVNVKLSAERKQVEEGETATLIRERSYPLIIQPEKEAAAETAEEDGEEANVDTPAEWPFPGFSRNLIGLSTGDERTLVYTYPEDSAFEMLRGKEADFHFIVESVKSRTLPELNDEFAHSQGEYDNLEALLSEIRTRLQEQKSTDYDNDYNDKVIGEVVSQSTVKYPPQMVEEEVHSLLHRLEDRLAQQKMDLETYLKTRQMDREALEKEFQPSAVARLKQYLVLYELARAEDIQVGEPEVMAETTRTIDQLSKTVTPEQARKTITPNFINNLSRSIMADLLIRHTMDRLRSIAKGEAQAKEAAEASSQAAEEDSGESQGIEGTGADDDAPEPQAIPENPSGEEPSPVPQATSTEATADVEPIGQQDTDEGTRQPAEEPGE